MYFRRETAKYVPNYCTLRITLTLFLFRVLFLKSCLKLLTILGAETSKSYLDSSSTLRDILATTVKLNMEENRSNTWSWTDRLNDVDFITSDVTVEHLFKQFSKYYKSIHYRWEMKFNFIDCRVVSIPSVILQLRWVDH